MGATLLVSPCAAERLHHAQQWLAARSLDEELLVVAANAVAAHELLRTAAKRRGAVFGWQRATLGRLALDIASGALATAGITPIGTIASEAVAARVVFGLRDRLHRYSPVVETPGFPRAVGRTLRELRMAGAHASALAGVDDELRAIAESYDAELASAALIDRAGLLRLAKEVAQHPRNGHPLLGLPLLLLDVPVETREERDLLAAISDRAPHVLATTPAGDERALRYLTEALGCEATRIAEAGDSTSLLRLQHHIFSETAPPQLAADDTVTIFSAPGEARECVEIARRIHHEARNGTRFDQMAILLRSPSHYCRPLEHALHRAGIPAYFAQGVVRPDPAGRALLALLRCAAEKLSARHFAEYMSLGEVPNAAPNGQPPPAASSAERWVPPDEETLPARVAEALTGMSEAYSRAFEVAPQPEEVEDDDPTAGAVAPDAAGFPEDVPVIGGTLRAPRRWEKLLVEAAVVGGLDRWRRRLHGLEQALRLDLEELKREDPDAARVAVKERDLSDLRALRYFAMPLLEELAAFPTSAPWGEWLDRLSGLCTRTLRHPERVLQLLGELTPMAPIGPVNIAEVLQALSPHLLDLRVAPKARHHGHVFVGPIDASRGLCFEVVFAPGLAERLFPNKVDEDPILLDDARRLISPALATNADRITDERRQLQLAVGAARRRVVFSFPRIDLDYARPRIPSFYALESMRAAEGRLPFFEELATRAEMVADAHIGWPAPREPEDAIDEAEYDLALLRPLHELPEEESRGRARYLLIANPHLGRALRFRYRRWKNRWTQADGLIVQSQRAREALRIHGLDRRSFSPNGLQHFAECPYRFFLHTVMRLAPRETGEAIDELSPLQRGALLHEVQFSLLRELTERGLLPVRPRNWETVVATLDGVLMDAATRWRDDLAPAIESVWRDGIASIRADLREWLLRMSEDDSGFVPWRFELAFGLAGRRQRDAHSIDDPVVLDGGLSLRGSIDLVERNPENALRITDHKTGKAVVKASSIIEGGISLQAVLYPLAVEKLVPSATVQSGRLSFCTVAGGFALHEVPLDSKAKAAAQLVAKAVADAIHEGFLPALPLPDQCSRCEYQVVCGPHEERRTRRKPDDRRIEMLIRLRGHP